MARRRDPKPRHLVLLDALGTLWVIVALWAFYPLLTSVLTQALVGLYSSVAKGQPIVFVPPATWIMPAATPWLGLATAALVITWVWGVRSSARRRAAGKRLEELRSMTPAEFEQWVEARFRELGYTVQSTGRVNDHGVDLVGKRDREKIVIQCKPYRETTVGEPMIRDLFGALQHEAADRAFLVTTGYFTAAATAWARGKPIALWDRQHITWLGVAASVAPTEPMPWLDNASTGAALTAECPRCSSRLVERRNRRTGQAFLARLGYPAGRYTRSLATRPS